MATAQEPVETNYTTEASRLRELYLAGRRYRAAMARLSHLRELRNSQWKRFHVECGYSYGRIARAYGVNPQAVINGVKRGGDTHE